MQLAYWSMAKNAFTEDPDVDINDCQHFLNEQAQLFLEQCVSEDRVCALSTQGGVGIMAFGTCSLQYTVLYKLVCMGMHGKCVGCGNEGW